MRLFPLAWALSVLMLPAPAFADAFCSSLHDFVTQWPGNATALPDGASAIAFPDWLEDYHPTCYLGHNDMRHSSSYNCIAQSPDSVVRHLDDVFRAQGQNPPRLPRDLVDQDAAGLADAIGQCLGLPVTKTPSAFYELDSGRTSIVVSFGTDPEDVSSIGVTIKAPDPD